MKNLNLIKISAITLTLLIMVQCKPNYKLQKQENKTIPSSFVAGDNDTLNSAAKSWNKVFTDSNLVLLIDSALKRNQELNIVLQEINISRNEVRARKGAYLPAIGAGIGAGTEKVGRYTSQGANDANTDIMPGKAFPDPLPDFMLGFHLSWEVDIWNKLRNSKRAAARRYLASIEGKNFMVTNLISEIANSYFELMALDNQLAILKQNIEIQQNALEIVKMEKSAARLTELAVRKFEAEVLKNQSRQYAIRQQIIETENKINYLVGRFPQPVKRNSANFTQLVTDTMHSGIPSALLVNRPDIRKAEQELAAARLDIKAARAEFFPSLRITGAGGYQAFNTKYLFQTPQSLLFSIAGDMVAPLINRSAIKANYYSANARQIQTAYNYERTILKAYSEVVNQLANIDNLKSSFEYQSKQVEALNESIDISIKLFRSARADYMEVLMTQRDALESKFELIETKKQQLNAMVNIYRALGGGWR